MPLTRITSVTGKAVPVLGADMDTDRIIPARFLKCVTFDELAGTMFYDERFTSVLAHQAMLDGGLKKKARQNKALVDEISATIILQSYLESRR